MASLLEVRRLVADGHHNAFTDLIEWNGAYYLAFRKSETHGLTPGGSCVILRSTDLDAWETCAVLSTGGDDRDPKFIHAGDRLGVVFGTWFPRWRDRSLTGVEADLVSHVCLSRNGTAWSAPRQVYGINYWLWRIFASADEGYFCAAYHFPQRRDRLMRSVHLLRSDDLLDWHAVGMMREGGGCGEPVLFQPAPGELRCVARSLEPDNHSWLGRSQAPYTRWEWQDLGVMIHAPVVLDTKGGYIVAGRSQPRDLPAGICPPDSGAHTTVWRLADNGAIEHLLTLPSQGDCSYCGLAHGARGEVLMSYYSQHEREIAAGEAPTPADVYLARFSV